MAQGHTREPVFVKPAEGSLIRHPASFREMPADGFEIKPNDPHRGYWNRQIRTGDLVVSPRPAPPTRTVPRQKE